jgi:hypothetical protein
MQGEGRAVRRAVHSGPRWHKTEDRGHAGHWGKGRLVTGGFRQEVWFFIGALEWGKTVVGKVWHLGMGRGCHGGWPVARDKHGTQGMPSG